MYELVEGLSANFSKQLQPTPDSPRIVAKVRGFESEEDIRRQLNDDETEIHLYPTLLGGGGNNGGLFKMIIGAIIIAIVIVAIVMTGGASLFSPSTWQLTAFGSTLLMTGVSMFVGGLIEVLTPAPKMDMNASNDIESSKYLGAYGNTIKIGTPIPILMGTHKFFGHIISFNVDSKNVAA